MTGLRRAVTGPLAIAAVELRRFLRDRSAIFFVFIFPLVLVFLIGAQFGQQGGGGHVAVAGAGSGLRTALVDALRSQHVDVALMARDDALQQVARERLDVAVLVGPDAARAYAAGRPLRVTVVPGAQATATTALQRVRVAVDDLGLLEGQRTALTERGVPADRALAALDSARTTVRPPGLQVRSVSALDRELAGVGRFDFGASGQLLLFVFLASLTGSATLIQARRLGVVSRTLAAPVSTLQVVVGEALGRFAVAAFQGGYIMAATALLFGVEWGSLWLALLVLADFALVAAGAAMLIGAGLDSEAAASAIGVGAGLVLAAVGGCMLPLELFHGTMRTVAHVTPHAWAYEALADVQRRHAGFLDVLPRLGVLAAMAAVLLAAGGWVLRRRLSGPGNGR